MEAQGARDRPPAIQYLSVHCDISQLVLSSGSGEVTKVPVRGFLQIATTSWNSMSERWLPDFVEHAEKNFSLGVPAGRGKARFGAADGLEEFLSPPTASRQRRGG